MKAYECECVELMLTRIRSTRPDKQALWRGGLRYGNRCYGEKKLSGEVCMVVGIPVFWPPKIGSLLAAWKSGKPLHVVRWLNFCMVAFLVPKLGGQILQSFLPAVQHWPFSSNIVVTTLG